MSRSGRQRWDWNITVVNLSSLAWDRDIWQVGAGESDKVNWTDEVTAVPAQTLAAHDGAATAAASTEHMGWFAQDALWMSLTYTSAAGSFGVSVQQKFHMFGIGGQCLWQVWTGSDWGNWSTDASPYTWTFATAVVNSVPTLWTAARASASTSPTCRPDGRPLFRGVGSGLCHCSERRQRICEPTGPVRGVEEASLVVGVGVGLAVSVDNALTPHTPPRSASASSRAATT